MNGLHSRLKPSESDVGLGCIWVPLVGSFRRVRSFWGLVAITEANGARYQAKWRFEQLRQVFEPVLVVLPHEAPQ